MAGGKIIAFQDKPRTPDAPGTAPAPGLSLAFAGGQHEQVEAVIEAMAQSAQFGPLGRGQIATVFYQCVTIYSVRYDQDRGDLMYIVAVQKSGSSRNLIGARMVRASIVAVQKSGSSRNSSSDQAPTPRIVAVQKSGSSRNRTGTGCGSTLIVAVQKSGSSRNRR